jgi:hypothetical protein
MKVIPVFFIALIINFSLAQNEEVQFKENAHKLVESV